MGLLWVDGVPLHDDDQELIAQSQSANVRSRFINNIDDCENYAGPFDAREMPAFDYEEWLNRLRIRAEYHRARRAQKSA